MKSERLKVSVVSVYFFGYVALIVVKFGLHDFDDTQICVYKLQCLLVALVNVEVELFLARV